MGLKRAGKLCYFCDQVIVSKEFAVHQSSHANELEKVRFSNDMNDASKTKCKICYKVLRISRVRSHTKSTHGMSITEYKEKFKQHTYDLIEKVLHKCGICGEMLLLDSDAIAQHLNSNSSHNLTHAEYNAKFMTTMRPDKLAKNFIKEESVDSLDTTAFNHFNGISNENGDKIETDAAKGSESDVVNEHIVENIRETLTSENNDTETEIESENTRIKKEACITSLIQDNSKVGFINEHTTSDGTTVESTADEVNSSLAEFRQFLGSRGLPSYPALEALLGMEKMDRECLIKTAEIYCRS